MGYEESLFTYLISDKKDSNCFEHDIYMSGLGIYIFHTAVTDVAYQMKNGREIAIIGLCIDAHNEIEREDIPDFVLSKGQPFSKIFTLFDRFAGKYVVVYHDGKNGCMFGDATGSIQINYGFGTNGTICAASTDQLVADHFQFVASETSIIIRQGSSLSQGLPGDMTMYDGVKALLPNHYLDLSTQKAIRIPLHSVRERSEVGQESIVKDSLSLIRSIVREYAKYYKIVCPLTSGYDSRLVFAFLKEQNPNVQCYTFRHVGFSDKSDDICVPKSICDYYHQQYFTIPDISVPVEYMHEIAAVVGEYQSKETIDLAFTFRSRFKEEALINGNIVDQVGKSLIGNSMPTCFATPLFFRCKIHNSKRESSNELKRYLSEIRNAGDWKDVFDLFAMENRCGRWASQTDMLYSVCSVRSLNIFNCRELILKWISLPRKIRTKHWLHEKLFTAIDTHLLDYPFNPSSHTIDLLKSNWLLFWLATLAKQFLSEWK